MQKYSKKNLENIQNIFENKTGRSLNIRKNYLNYRAICIAIAATVLIMIIVLADIPGGKYEDESMNLVKAKEETPVALSDTQKGETEEMAKGIKRYKGNLAFENWVWPTENNSVSSLFGVQRNGTFSDHINIAGEKGEKIYAVAGGCVTDTGYDAKIGNFITLDLGNDMQVVYAHLKDIFVENGDYVECGACIGSMGATGMATGPNLYFAVYIREEAVNPLKE